MGYVSPDASAAIGDDLAKLGFGGSGDTAQRSATISGNMNADQAARGPVNWDGTADNTGAREDVNRYQQMGVAARMTPAYQGDYTQAQDARGQSQQARGSQLDALGLMQGAANGTAPSRAEILGNSMAQQGLAAQMAMGASAHGGPLAQAAAMHNAQAGAAQYQQQAATQMMGQRADEMAQARNAYMGGASAIRGADDQTRGLDYQQNALQQQSELAQRQLNQQGQLAYEGLGYNVNAAQLGAGSGNRASYIQQQQYGQGRDDAMTGSLISAAGAVAPYAALALSDERAKQEVFPMAAQTMGSLGPWMPPTAYPDSLLTSDENAKSGLEPMDDGPMGKAALDSYLADRFGNQEAPAAPPKLSQRMGPSLGNLAAGGLGAAAQAFGQTYGHQHQQMLTSDPNAKREMYELGRAHGSISAQSHEQIPWAYGSPEGAKRLMDNQGAPPTKQDVYAIAAAPRAALPRATGTVLERSPGEAAEHTARALTFFAPPRVVAEQAAQRIGPVAQPEPLVMQQRAPTGIAPVAGSLASAAQTPARHAAMGVPPQDELAMKTSSQDAKNISHDGGTSPQFAAPASMMDAIGSGVAFKYKPGVGEDPNKQQFGTTTQQLRMTPMGASMVKPGPNGFDAIDTREAVGPTLASLGNLNQRLRALESKKGR